MAQEQGENSKKLIIFFGECDFNFTYHYYMKNFENNSSPPNHEILATEYCDEKTIRKEYTVENINMIREKCPNGPIHMFFSVDLSEFKLDDERWKNIVKNRTPEEIRFNFPWYKGKGKGTGDLVNTLFKKAYELLDSNGKLIVGLYEGELGNQLGLYRDRYGIAYDENKNGITFKSPDEIKFEYKSKQKISEIYPNYKHCSSLPDAEIEDIKKYGYEYHYIKKGSKEEEQNENKYSLNQLQEKSENVTIIEEIQDIQDKEEEKKDSVESQYEHETVVSNFHEENSTFRLF